MIKTHFSKHLLNNLTQRCPVGDERVSELSPAAIVLQQPDEGGRRAGGPTELTQLWQTLTVLPDDAHQPVREGGATYTDTYMSGWLEKGWCWGYCHELRWVCLYLSSTLALWWQVRALQALKPSAAEEAHWEMSSSTAHTVLHTEAPAKKQS